MSSFRHSPLNTLPNTLDAEAFGFRPGLNVERPLTPRRMPRRPSLSPQASTILPRMKFCQKAFIVGTSCRSSLSNLFTENIVDFLTRDMMARLGGERSTPLARDSLRGDTASFSLDGHGQKGRLVDIGAFTTTLPTGNYGNRSTLIVDIRTPASRFAFLPRKPRARAAARFHERAKFTGRRRGRVSFR